MKTQATGARTESVGIQPRGHLNAWGHTNKSFSWLRMAVGGWIAVGLTLTASVARAQIAYEQFAYTPGSSISGQNGGAGWVGPWTGPGNVVTPGSTVSCNGQMPLATALGPSSGATRTLSTPITGAQYTSVNLSAVVNSNVAGTSSTQAILTNSAGGFTIGDLGVGKWALQTSAGVVVPSSTLVAASVPTCLVAQIDFSVSLGMDRVSLWVNPPDPRSLAQKPDATAIMPHIAMFSGITWLTTGGSQIVQEVGINYGGTWTPTTNQFPGGRSDATLLLTDGTVLVLDGWSGTDWYKLTPDIHGNYINGTWTKKGDVAPLPAVYTPQFFGSAVLPDGRVIIEGGEHSSYTNGAIYDPIANSWTLVPAPGFGDACGSNNTSWCGIGGPPTVVLPDGTFMIGDAAYLGLSTSDPVATTEALLPPPYNVNPNSWTPTGPSKHDPNSEEGWTLLPSPRFAPDLALVLAVDTYTHVPFTNTVCGGFHSSEIYIKGTYSGTLPGLGLTGPFPGDWYCLGDTPDQLYPTGGDNEMGPAVLRPGVGPSDWSVFQAGATKYTAILGANFAWSHGPVYPMDSSGNQLMMRDAPVALLPNGNVLMVASPADGCAVTACSPSTFLELTPDPANVLIQVPGVPYSSALPSNGGEMLGLPTGQILFIPNILSPSGDLEIYTPNNATYNPNWAPTISSYPKVLNAGAKNLSISGTQFNGMSQATAFGDEYQNATNYPLALVYGLTGAGTGNTYYLRTHDHSTMGVATGSREVSTHFDVPDVTSPVPVPPGTYCLVVVANGIPSSPSNLDPVNGNFTVPGTTCANEVQVLDAYVEVCKSSSSTNPVTGSFTFTSPSFVSLPNNSATVPVGTCSGPIPVVDGPVTITEGELLGGVAAPLPTGVSLNAVAASGYNPTAHLLENRLLVSNLTAGTATVTAVAGDSSVETVATFTNQGPTGQLKICKIADPGVTVGTSFNFTATSPATATSAATTQSYTVPAGPPLQGGYCVIDSITFPVGVNVTVAEVLPAMSPYIVTSVVSPAGTTGGKSIAATIGTGFTEVTFTNGTFQINSDGAVIWNTTNIAGSPVPHMLPITVTSTPAVAFTATATVTSGPAGWLAVSPGQGTTPATLTLSAPALPVGTYTGAITIATVDGTTAVSFPVTLTVALPTPALGITETHQGSFTQGQANANYTVTVSNEGTAATTGTVTVSDIVPVDDPIPGGLTLVSMSGSGWSCSGSTCTRRDALNPGASYPAITIAVNVPSNAPSRWTNQVTVSGGGSAPASASDLTTIVPSAPTISLVANAEGESPVIAPNTWVEIKGVNLAPAGDTRSWQGSDFVNGTMPTQLDGVSVTVNGKPAYVYHISPTQVDILTPPDAVQGSVQVQLTNNGASSAPASVQAQPLSPSFFVFNGGPYVAAEHPNQSPLFVGPASLFPGSSTPAKPGETVVLYANGFGATNPPVVSGSVTQSGGLSSLPAITIGGINATVSFAALVAPGQFQFHVRVPASLADGDQPITATYNGSTTQAGTLITIQH